jgi:hypothetical protein
MYRIMTYLIHSKIPMLNRNYKEENKWLNHCELHYFLPVVRDNIACIISIRVDTGITHVMKEQIQIEKLKFTYAVTNILGSGRTQFRNFFEPSG